MHPITRLVRKVVRSRGFDMVHYAPWKNLFKAFEIDLILDVGAHAGETYDSFRWAGFEGPINSYEPNSETFHRLQTKNGALWQKFQLALSSQTGQLKFFVTNNDNTCGLQAPLGDQYKVVREIVVPAWRLDELWQKEGISAKHVFLKIDAEGHDLEVIKGAAGVLDRIDLIMAEVSPLSRYVGEPPLHEFLNYMNELGFRVCRIDKSALNIEAGIDTAPDIVFAKTKLLEKLSA